MWFKRQPIRISQNILSSSYRWLETIVLVDDIEAERCGDYTVGFYHCKQCDTYQGFAIKLPPKPEPFCPRCNRDAGNGFGCVYSAHEGARYPVAREGVVSARAHNERNAFWRAHAHGDGLMLLLERDIPEPGVKTEELKEVLGIKNIIVNAAKVQWKDDEITYDEVVRLAGFKRGIYSVTFRDGRGSSGIMSPGKVARVNSGMIFNASNTSSA